MCATNLFPRWVGREQPFFCNVWNLFARYWPLACCVRQHSSTSKCGRNFVTQFCPSLHVFSVYTSAHLCLKTCLQACSSCCSLAWLIHQRHPLRPRLFSSVFHVDSLWFNLCLVARSCVCLRLHVFFASDWNRVCTPVFEACSRCCNLGSNIPTALCSSVLHVYSMWFDIGTLFSGW